MTVECLSLLSRLTILKVVLPAVCSVFFFVHRQSVSVTYEESVPHQNLLKEFVGTRTAVVCCRRPNA